MISSLLQLVNTPGSLYLLSWLSLFPHSRGEEREGEEWGGEEWGKESGEERGEWRGEDAPTCMQLGRGGTGKLWREQCVSSTKRSTATRKQGRTKRWMGEWVLGVPWGKRIFVCVSPATPCIALPETRCIPKAIPVLSSDPRDFHFSSNPRC